MYLAQCHTQLAHVLFTCTIILNSVFSTNMIITNLNNILFYLVLIFKLA